MYIYIHTVEHEIHACPKYSEFCVIAYLYISVSVP